MRKFVMSAVAAVLAAGVSLGVSAAEVTGAGASFPAPIYAKWADAYQKATGNRINYQSVGSGAGLRQIAAKTVDFGASDAPLKPEDLSKGGLVQFPAVIGGIVPVINVAGVKPGEMKLTGELLAEIYLGNIVKWNDAKLKAANPSLNLPDAPIAVVRRADGSGTTFVFTNYLSKVSADWKKTVGEGTAVQWPTGLGGKGNEGVSAFVQRLPNAIGYVEYAYAKQNKLTWTLVQNKDKAFPEPDDKSFAAASAYADWSNAFYEILTEEPGKESWPITSASFIMMHVQQEKPAQAAEVLKFFDWAFKNGGAMAMEMEYVPMPAATVKTIRDKVWPQIKDASGKPVFSGK